MNNPGLFFANHKWGVLSILILTNLGVPLCGHAQGTQPAPASSDVYVPNLKGIVIVARSEDVQQAGVPDVQGVVIKGPSFLQRPAFEALLQKHLGTQLTEAAAKDLQVEIIKYCRSIDHSVVDVFYREQEIVNGTIQIAVVEGRVGKVAIKHDGTAWFSDKLILGDLHLKSGDPIIQSKLDGDINWLNQNTFDSLGTFQGTFRDVRTELTPGDELGEVNVNILETDRVPFRAFAGYDNDGIPVIGKDRLFAGLEWANAFGLDHRFTYQYTTDSSMDRYKSQLASYTIPLASHQEFTLLGAYSTVDPNFALFGPSYSNLHINNGTLDQVSARYTVTLNQSGDFRQNLSIGFDYKHIDTPLFFGTSSAGLLSANLIDVAQFTLGYQGFLFDNYGSTAISLQAVDSPGGFGSNNNNASFQAFMANPSAKASYQYGTIEIRRETKLPGGFSWMLRGLAQFSGSTLIASETFGLGGYSTVPGYDERTVTGDRGWLIQNELRTPLIGMGNITAQKNTRDSLQFFAFFDAGGVNQQNPTLGQVSSDQLVSAGGGLRYQMSDKIHVRLDYGSQLKRNYLNDPGNLTTQSTGKVEFGVDCGY
jgi:hemolysin activation/secretion protein